MNAVRLDLIVSARYGVMWSYFFRPITKRKTALFSYCCIFNKAVNRNVRSIKVGGILSGMQEVDPAENEALAKSEIGRCLK